MFSFKLWGGGDLDGIWKEVMAQDDKSEGWEAKGKAKPLRLEFYCGKEVRSSWAVH